MSDSILDGTEIWLDGDPYSRQSLREADRMLTAMEDVVVLEDDPVPGWLIAARAAVREALREDTEEPMVICKCGEPLATDADLRTAIEENGSVWCDACGREVTAE